MWVWVCSVPIGEGPSPLQVRDPPTTTRASHQVVQVCGEHHRGPDFGELLEHGSGERRGRQHLGALAHLVEEDQRAGGGIAHDGPAWRGKEGGGVLEREGGV